MRVKSGNTQWAAEKGSTETGLRFVRLGGAGKPWQRMGARITPSLTAAVRAPEIARSGVLFSLQMHLSLGANTSLLGEVIPVVVLAAVQVAESGGGW